MKPSILGSIANFTIGDTITIPITKYNSSFSDTLNIYIGTTWIKRVEGIVNNQKVSFTTTEINNIYAAMPSVTSASFRFVNTTYNGANIVGTNEKVAGGFIDPTVKPAITSVTLVEAVTGITAKFGGYVQYQSKIQCTIAATAGTGSQISSYSGNIGSFVVMENPTITSRLSKSGTNDYKLTVVDKRNRATTTTGTFNVLAYENPEINKFSVVRCDSNGNENLYGNRVKINVSAVISSVNNKNNKLFKVQYKLRNATTWTDLLTYNTGYEYTLTDSIHSGFSVDNTYDFRLVVTDYFTSIERGLTISAGFAIIDLKGNGKGMALGKVSTKDALEIGFDMYDKFDTKISNGLSMYGGSANPIDVDTTLEELVLSTKNTPTTDFWYVRTMFYSTKSTTSNRTQVAYPYNKLMPTYYRIYFNGGWSEWKTGDIKEYSFEDGNGYVWFGNGLLIQWGRVSITPTAASTVTSATITFPKAYDYQPKVEAIPNVAYPNLVTTAVGGGTTLDVSKQSMVIYMTRTNVVATTFQWFAIGVKGV